MTISVISFTRQGSLQNHRLVKALCLHGNVCHGYMNERYIDCSLPEGENCIYSLKQSLNEWTKTHFSQADALIFIGATGIAVRAIAPFLKDKWSDPAVVVIDETCSYVIPLLSGHMGGANQLAEWISKELGAVCVTTTATDVEDVFAVDLFAKKNNLIISDRTTAKTISSALLDGEKVGFYGDFQVNGLMPAGLTQNEICKYHVWITMSNSMSHDSVLYKYMKEDSQILRLIPKCLYLGIGCRKGISSEQIETEVKKILIKYHLDERAVTKICSIDLKKNEPGLIDFAEKHQWELITFSAEQLGQVKGSFQSSEFVKNITGVDNVCERAAMLCAGEKAVLCIPKQADCGVTIAAAFPNKEFYL